MTPSIFIGSPAYVREAFLRDVPATEYAPMHPIVKIVCQASGYSFAQLCGKGREASLVTARMCAMYYLTRSGMSLVKVGQMLKHDHATVFHARKHYPSRVETVGYGGYAALDAEVLKMLKHFIGI